jgi:hypothetical protein
MQTEKQEKRSSPFFKTWYWSRIPGKFIDKETGKEPERTVLTPGPMYTGTVREWAEFLGQMVSDASNYIQVENGVNPYTVIAFNRQTKTTSYVECYSPIKQITTGLNGKTILERCIIYRFVNEFSGTLNEKTEVKFDPMYPDDVLVVGEFGKNPILIKVID